jgi:hypothetical protein
MLQQLFGSYGNLLVPAVVVLLGVIVLIKIVIALEHAVLRIATSLLTIIVLGTALIVGSSMIGRIHGIQSAAAAAARSVNTPTTNGVIQASVLQRQLDSNARQALTGVGLNPAYLHLRISCGATGATLHLQYSDTSFLYGLLSHQEFAAALPNTVRCR